MADVWDQFQDAPSDSGADPWAQFADADAPPEQPPAQAPQPQAPNMQAEQYAGYDALASLGTGAVATPIAGLAGLGAIATNAVGLTDTAPGDVVERVQGALTYQPRTQGGQQAVDVLSYIPGKIAQGADWVGGAVTDSAQAYLPPSMRGGAAAIGAGVNTAIQSAPALLLKGRGSGVVRPNGNNSPNPVAGRVAPVQKATPAPKPAAAPNGKAGLGGVSKSAPSIDELRTQAAEAYKRADQAGVVVAENSLKGLKTRIVSLTKKEGLDKDLHPDSSAVLNKILKSKGQLTLSEVETLRKVANDAKGSIKPADKRMASKIVDELDDYIDNLDAKDVVAGDATKAKALKEARGLYSRMKKAETLEDLVQRAELSAPNFSASGMENALRTEFRNLAKNQRKMRMFTAEEQAAIRKVAQGGKVENALRFIGKFAPTGVVSGVLTGSAAAMIGGPLGATLPVAGLAGRYGATRMTQRNVARASELVRRGPQPPQGRIGPQGRPQPNALARTP